MAGKVVELLDVGDINGQEMLTRYHFWNEDGVADPAVLVSDYVTNVLPLLCAVQSPLCKHSQINTTVVAPTKELVQETPVNPVQVGTLSGTALPYTVTYSLKWNIGPSTDINGGPVAGHIKRGGKHIAGPTTNPDSANGLYNGTEDTALQAYFTALHDIDADNWVLVVYSPLQTGAHAHPERIAPVTGMVVRGFGTQTTRKPGRGA